VTTKLLRDAVHGDIELGPLEVELMDTEEFQRLRGIKQLGTACLVYPSATHTRFEHSLGTVWMARRMIEALRRSRPISAAEEDAIRAAALLHDITHLPFGHTLEDERRVLPRHDQDPPRFQYFFEATTTAERLKRAGLQEQVVRILRGEAGFASDIVLGPVSADLLDYLRRDTYFTGLSQYWDPRLFQSLSLQGSRLVIHLDKKGRLRRDALSELINLLRIRYQLTERVYFHHTKIASGAMISRACERALALGLDAKELWRQKDETLILMLRDRYGSDPAVGHLIRCLDRRQLYRSCYVITEEAGESVTRSLVERFHHSAAEREEMESRIARAAGVEPHQILLYCPARGMSLVEAEVPVRLPGGAILPLSGANNDEIRVLKDKHKALWSFFVFMDRSAWDRSEAAGSAAAESVRR